jgi:hypothetical protein
MRISLYFVLQDEYTATGEKTWMLTSNFRALRAKFREVFVALSKKVPVTKHIRKAWHGFIDQFVEIEMPDFLEFINVSLGMPNPLTEKKLQIFGGTFLVNVPIFLECFSS